MRKKRPPSHFAQRMSRIGKLVQSPAAILGIAGAVSVVCGLVVSFSGFVFAAGVFALIALGLTGPWLGVAGLRLRIEPGQSRIHVGESLPLAIFLTNYCPWPVWDLALDGLGGAPTENREAFGQSRIALPRVAGWSRMRYDCHVDVGKRGRLEKASAHAQTSFPFGMLIARRRAQFIGDVVVWPKVHALPVANLHRSGPPSVTPGAVLPRSGNEFERLAIRSYRDGDSFRHVHWPQTARLDRLMVCERQQFVRHRTELFVAVDERRGNERSAAREWAISAAASALAQLVSQQHEVCLNVPGRLVRINEPRQLSTALDTLALFDDDKASSATRMRTRILESSCDVRLTFEDRLGTEDDRCGWVDFDSRFQFVDDAAHVEMSDSSLGLENSGTSADVIHVADDQRALADLCRAWLTWQRGRCHASR